MLLSCKISYSALVYSEVQGIQWQSFIEKRNEPIEFLKDPSYWLQAEEMEAFLNDFSLHLAIDDATTFYTQLGKKSFDLRAWGVLDSVLKMVESPFDIFSQPDRFISYFMSPHPEVQILESAADRVKFKIELDESSIPLTFAYLKGAFEGLPQYMSLPAAKIEQENGLWEVSWDNDRPSLLSEEESRRRQLHPDVVKTVMDNLQDRAMKKGTRQKVIENDEPIAFDEEIKMSEELQAQVEFLFSQKDEFSKALLHIKNDFYQVYDYFTRAQQLITLISGSAKKSHVKEAMHRVDWTHVQQSFPSIIEKTCESILDLKGIVENWQSHSSALALTKREPVDLNNLLDKLIEGMVIQPDHLKIDKHWLLDRPVTVDIVAISKAIGQVLKASVDKSRKGGEVRIVTRPNGRQIEIEVTDTGEGFGEEELLSVFQPSSHPLNLSEPQKIIREHQGNISISSQQGQGSTILIELPLH